MNIELELEQEIIAELRKVRAPAKVARNLGIDIRTVLAVSDKFGGASRNNRPELYGGYGRPELSEFFVARKRAYQVWDNSLPEIAQARSDYEAGTHEMITGRDGDWLIIYSIPREKPCPRPDYFKPEF